MAKKGEEKEEGHLPDDLKSLLQEDLVKVIEEKNFEKYSYFLGPSDDLKAQEKAWLETELRDMDPKMVRIEPFILEIPSPNSVICDCRFLVENQKKIRLLFSRIFFQKSQERWLIEDKANKETSEYYSISLRLEETERFEELEIPFEGFHIKMSNGYLTPGYVNEGISAAVLVGEGRLTSIPTTPRAQSMLINSTGKERLEESFSECWIRINEEDYQCLVRKRQNQRTYPPEPIEMKIKSVMEKYWKRSYHSSLTTGWTWSLEKGSHVADLRTGSLGWIHYYCFRQESEPEPWLDVGTLEPDRLLWGSGPVHTIHTDKQVPSVDVEHYVIRLELVEEGPQIQCEASVQLTLLEGLEGVILNLNPSLEIDSISDKDGIPLYFTQEKKREEQIVSISLGRRIREGENLILRFKYHGSIMDRDEENKWKIWDKVSKDMTWLRMESMWYPLNGYDDLAMSDVKIRVPAGLLAVCTGEKVGEERTPLTWTTRWRTSQPTRNITIAIAGYQLERMNFSDEERVRYGIDGLELYITSNLANKAALISEKAKDILSFYAERFGPLPYPKLKIAEIGDEYGGGYGPQSLVLIQSFSLHYLKTEESDSILAHEMAHQWWGTILAEPMAEYSAHCYLEARGNKGALVERMQAVRRWAIASSVVEPLSSKEPPGRYTSSIRFCKGMCVIHMLRQVLGDDLFFKGWRNIAGKYRDGRLHLHRDLKALGADEFQESFEEVAGKSLKGFFDLWFRDTKIPKYSTEWNYDLSGDQYKVYVRIHSDPASHAMMPLEVVTNEHRQRERVLLDKPIVEANYITKDKPVDVIFNYDQSFLGTNEKSLK